MSQEVLLREPVRKTFTASQERCPEDGAKLWVSQHRVRTIHRLDETIEATFRDTRCPRDDCSLSHVRFRPVEESMLALRQSSFGLDVVTAIGAMRFRDDFSFPRIHQRLRDRGVPISEMGVQYQFRNYLALVSCQAGLTDPALIETLKKQGGIIPVIDGVQFGEGDPVLYLIIDALSRRPLFGKELFCRGADDLIPFIAQLKEIGVPILAAVSDKEKAVVVAIAEALPGVKHQLCQLHYVENAAKPMEDDLKVLGAEIRQTRNVRTSEGSDLPGEQDLRAYERKLLRQKQKAEKASEPVSEDLGVSLELCEAARAEARRQARAPFDPPALKRHEGLEKVAEATATAGRKKGGPGRTSRNSKAS